jgi:hypothetical protein
LSLILFGCGGGGSSTSRTSSSNIPSTDLFQDAKVLSFENGSLKIQIANSSVKQQDASANKVTNLFVEKLALRQFLVAENDGFLFTIKETDGDGTLFDLASELNFGVKYTIDVVVIFNGDVPLRGEVDFVMAPDVIVSIPLVFDTDFTFAIESRVCGNSTVS